MKLPEISKKIKEVFPEHQAIVLKEMVELMNSLVKADDFNELKNIVKEIAEEQKKLVIAQNKTEKRVEELAESQNRLEKVVEQLAESQNRLERVVEQLAEEQKKLVIAQSKTEEELKNLIQEHRKTREQLGGLSHTIGYLLENKAYYSLPLLLERDFGIQVIETLKRKNFLYKNREVEINIIGKGIDKNHKELWILGEAKTQLKKKDIDIFLGKSFIFDELFYGEKFYLMVTHMTKEQVKEYATSKNIKIYFSYEFSP